MEKIPESGKGGNALAEGDFSYAEGGEGGDSSRGPGGNGGHARATGKNSCAIGGRGGRGGLGKGGDGGNAEVLADNVTCVGGDGGESNQHDGRGGRGGGAPAIALFSKEYLRRARMRLPYGAPNIFFGRGGDTPDTPQYKARRLIVEQIKERYYVANSIPFSGQDIWYDRKKVPLWWLNKELEADGHKWTATIEDEEYVFSDIGF